MRGLSPMLTAIALAATLQLLGQGAEPAPDRVFLERYRGETPVPDDLYRTYASLVEAMRGADRDRIESLSLPGSVRIGARPRPEKQVEIGLDLNLPFARERYSPQILRVRKEDKDVYLLRTATSYLRFVAKRSGTWRLYHYGDKPIR